MNEDTRKPADFANFNENIKPDSKNHADELPANDFNDFSSEIAQQSEEVETAETEASDFN